MVFFSFIHYLSINSFPDLIMNNTITLFFYQSFVSEL